VKPSPPCIRVQWLLKCSYRHYLVNQLVFRSTIERVLFRSDPVRLVSLECCSLHASEVQVPAHNAVVNIDFVPSQC